MQWTNKKNKVNNEQRPLIKFTERDWNKEEKTHER